MLQAPTSSQLHVRLTNTHLSISYKDIPQTSLSSIKFMSTTIKTQNFSKKFKRIPPHQREEISPESCLFNRNQTDFPNGKAMQLISTSASAARRQLVYAAANLGAGNSVMVTLLWRAIPRFLLWSFFYFEGTGFWEIVFGFVLFLGSQCFCRNCFGS